MGRELSTLIEKIGISVQNANAAIEQVDVKLKFLLEEGGEDGVMMAVKSPEDMRDGFSMSELSLQFKSTPSAEGMARINNRYVQVL